MAPTSFWYVTAAPDHRLVRFADSIRAHVAEFTQAGGIREAFVEWSQVPSAVHGPDDHGDLPPAGARLLDAFRAAELPEQDLLDLAVPETEALTWDLSTGDRPHPVEGFFAAVAGVPVASLLYVGLGPVRSSALPGVLGVFSVAAGRVVEIADQVRKAHALSPFDRSSALERMHDWLSVGQDAGFPVHHLLEALPEVFGSAAASGWGVLGVTGLSQ